MRRTVPHYVLILLLLCMVLPATAHAWPAQIIAIANGNTLIVQRLDTRKPVTIHLYGIQAPQLASKNMEAQPYSKKARDFLRTLLPVDTSVTVMDMGFDPQTGSVGGIISLPGRKVVQDELLKAGLAWVHPQYCKDCRQWKSLETQAKKNKKGLWRSATPIPPWEWKTTLVTKPQDKL